MPQKVENKDKQKYLNLNKGDFPDTSLYTLKIVAESGYRNSKNNCKCIFQSKYPLGVIYDINYLKLA